MDLQAGALRALYLDVAEEYNHSPLAAQGHTYEPGAAKLRELSALVRHLPPGGTFLDVGTGMGIAPRLVKRLGVRSISLDSVATGGNIAADNVRLAGVETIICDVTREAIPLPAESVDVVLFADVIEHLWHSPKPALTQFQRVLKPGGVCVATTPNALRLAVRLKVMMGYSNWPNVADYYDEPVHIGHHHEYTIEEFRWSFTQGGFEIVEFVLHGRSWAIPVASFETLSSRNRHAAQAARRTHPLIALAKLPITALEAVVPRLRRDMLLVARKP